MTEKPLFKKLNMTPSEIREEQEKLFGEFQWFIRQMNISNPAHHLEVVNIQETFSYLNDQLEKVKK